jgi:excisionase family DNA binding protein
VRAARERGLAVHAHPAAAAGGPWLSVEAAAIYLSLSRKALYQAVRRGQVPAHRLGGKRLRFSQPELDRLLSAS